MECSKTPNRKETLSNESDDSDDEIIVKTLLPVHQAPSTDNKGLDDKDQDRDVQCSTENTSNNDIQIEDDLKGNGEAGNKEKFEVNEADKAGGNSGAEDEVFEKVQRDRMKFPCSSECNSSPTKSRLDDHSSKLVEHSAHHTPEQGTTKANHKELSEDNRTILQNSSAATKKKTFCHLN